MKTYKIELVFSNFYYHDFVIEAESSKEAFLVAIARSESVCTYDIIIASVTISDSSAGY